MWSLLGHRTAQPASPTRLADTTLKSRDLCGERTKDAEHHAQKRKNLLLFQLRPCTRLKCPPYHPAIWVNPTHGSESYQVSHLTTLVNLLTIRVMHRFISKAPYAVYKYVPLNISSKNLNIFQYLLTGNDTGLNITSYCWNKKQSLTLLKPMLVYTP